MEESLSSGSIYEHKNFIEGERKYTRLMTDQDFPGELLSKQNI